MQYLLTEEEYKKLKSGVESEAQKIHNAYRETVRTQLIKLASYLSPRIKQQQLMDPWLLEDTEKAFTDFANSIGLSR